MHEHEPERHLGNRSFGVFAVGLWLAYAALVNHFVPVAEVLSDRPLQGVDYDLHIGQIYRVVDALQRWGKSWLYDVQLLAGHPEGTILDAGSKGWELWTYLLVSCGIPRATAFNLFVLLQMWLAPVWMYLAGARFRMTRLASLVAAAMSGTLILFDSHVHWLWFVGMISWTGASCLAIFTLGLFFRFVEQARPRVAIGTALALGTTLLIHPYTFFELAPPMAALYVRAYRNLTRAGHFWTCVIGVTALAENAYWLHNAAQQWHYILNSAYYAQGRPTFLVCDFFDVLCSGPDTGVIGTRTGFRFLYFALGLAGLAFWQQTGERCLLPIATAIAALYGVSYFGQLLPGMDQTQPYRQITPAMLFTCLPAAALVSSASLAAQLRQASLAVKGIVAALSFALLQQLLATQVLYFFPELVPTPPNHPDGARSPLSGYGHVSHPALPDHVAYGLPHDSRVLEKGMEECLQWLEQNTHAGERILVQSGVLGERIAWRTHLEVIGGFFERNERHAEANYFRKYQNYKPDPGEVEHYLTTFAISWVISARPEFRKDAPLVANVTTAGACPIARISLQANKVLEGGGEVDASTNRIEVRGSDPHRALVVSYHWHESLRCKPDCRVERNPVDLDPVGFIRIPAPHPADLEIWNSYQF
ncbi:MAG TPA: hypothetical protein VFN67_33170 [Polyangiales bacterium]|nr:hypothetical protein [Polyangiales bacterium]